MPAMRAREPRHAGRVADDETAARLVAPHGPGRRRPDLAGLVVANEPGLGRRIGHRIVGKRRQPVLAAVLGPRVRRPRRGHDRAEAGIGDDVRPRRRRLLIALEHDRRRRGRRRRSRRCRCASVSGGTGTGSSIGGVRLGRARPPGRPASGARSGAQSGYGRSSCARRSPRSPLTTARATVSSSVRSAPVSASPRRR